MTIAAQNLVHEGFFPAEVLPVLVAILCASSGVYWFLVWRCTKARRQTVLWEWAAANRYRLHWNEVRPLPAALEPLAARRPRVCVELSSAATSLVQIELPGDAPAAGPSRWNVLVRKVAGNWPGTGFRPAVHARSLLDFFTLGSYPSLAPPERFLVQGTDTAAARALAGAPVRGLLPADVGLLVRGPWLVLDFSTRPFDVIELTRITALADQIAAHLPAVGAKN